jgi:RHS repeat-associated protein
MDYSKWMNLIMIRSAAGCLCSCAYCGDFVTINALSPISDANIGSGNARDAEVQTQQCPPGRSLRERPRLNRGRAGATTVSLIKSRNVLGAVTKEVRYLHRDHLGSITHITDNTGAVIEELAYDPHGKRRNALDWTDATTQIFASETLPGFTGHEGLDSVGLIHMKGRVYDPGLGRFLSADPNVQSLQNTQALNRYSYVLNNPLSFTDPSGFFLRAVAESFLNLLKQERIRRRTYKTRAEARQDVLDYIEMFYNPKRKHVRNGMLSPVEFERQQKVRPEGV